MKLELYNWIYQMDLYREHFSNDALKTIMLNTISFYETVHINEAHLVGPIDLHELFVNPENGHFEVNANIDRNALMQDIDSIKFMPPEILNMQSRWNLDADKFVLAELLFVLRYCKHPYDGRYVLEQPITDVNTARHLYSSCKFIFDPNDSINSLDYYTDPVAIDSWKHDENSKLKDAFIQTFTQGMSDTGARLSDSEWVQLI